MTRAARLRALLAATAALMLVGTLLPQSASAYWSVAASAPSSGGASAASVNQGATPTATVATQNDIAVAWAAATLSNGVAVTGYTVQRYSSTNAGTPATGGCAGQLSVRTCTESNVPDGVWTYTVTPRFAVNWVGAESAKSAPGTSDATAPVNAISLVPVSGNSIKNGDTVFYRGAAAGSFRLSNAVSDTDGSGPASSTTGTLSGTTAGWSHAPSSVSTPPGGPFESAPFSWTAGTTAEPAVGVAGRDIAGNTAATTVQFRRDDTPPTGGAISYPTGVARSGSLTVTVQPIADTGSGTGAGSRSLSYRAATLTGNTCGTFGAYIALATNPAVAPSTNTYSAANGNCIQVRYVFTDSVGNQTNNVGGVVKFKPTYPSVVTGTSGLVDYYRLGDAGTPIIDSQGGNNNGTSPTPPSLGGAGAIAADSNTSALFNGTNDYVSINRTIGANFSIEFWFRSTQGLGTTNNWYNGAGLVNAETAGNTTDFGVSLMADGRIAAGTGAPEISAFSGAGFDNGQWHHVVMTRTQASGIIQLYVDGVLSTSTTGGSTAALTAPATINFGRTPTGINYYAGSLDEVALYSTVLTAAQVKSHYDNAIP